MSPLDAGVDDAGHQIDAGQQALRPQSNVFVIARDGPMTHGLARRVGRLVGERLDPRLLVIGDEGDSRCLRGRFPASGFRRLFQLFDLAIDGNDLGHLRVKLGIAAFEVVAQFMRFDFGRGQYLAQSSLGKTGRTGVSGSHSPLAHVLGQQPGRPHFVRIAKILRLAAGQIDEESARLAGDGRLAPGTRTVGESRHDAELARPSQTSLDGLERHPDGSPGRIERSLLAIGQQDARPLDVVRRFRSRTRDAREIRQLLLRKAPFDQRPGRGHNHYDIRQSNKRRYGYRQTQTESPPMRAYSWNRYTSKRSAASARTGSRAEWRDC